MLSIPFLSTGNRQFDAVFRTAIGDIVGNIAPSGTGLLDSEAPVLMAGLWYGAWTRDAAINVWNGLSMIAPDIARNTLIGELEERDGDILMRGQYWDAVIWVIGAWHHYLCTGDREFLNLSFRAGNNWLRKCEQEELDEKDGLFRGAGCYLDGISGYPDRYTHTDGSSCILDWAKANPDSRSRPGFGLPMKALSTNCLYAESYRIMACMCRAVGQGDAQEYERKAGVVVSSIEHSFWMEDRGYYRFLIDPFGGCDMQEGLGHAFALLFGIAPPAHASKVINAQHSTNAGIPSIWPCFERYRRTPEAYGRHAGTVWPHIQGFWADAMCRQGKWELFTHEMMTLMAGADRDKQFAEIYHPDTGAIYGGLQEIDTKSREEWHSWCLGPKDRESASGAPMRLWKSLPRQSWSATAFVRMVFTGLCGMRFTEEGILFEPAQASPLAHVWLRGLVYRGGSLDIEITGQGTQLDSVTIDGEQSETAFLPAKGRGNHRVVITMA